MNCSKSASISRAKTFKIAYFLSKQLWLRWKQIVMNSFLQVFVEFRINCAEFQAAVSFFSHKNIIQQGLQQLIDNENSRQRMPLSISHACPQCMKTYVSHVKVQHWITHFYRHWNSSKIVVETGWEREKGKGTWSKLPKT